MNQNLDNQKENNQLIFQFKWGSQGQSCPRISNFSGHKSMAAELLEAMEKRERERHQVKPSSGAPQKSLAAELLEATERRRNGWS
jgi:hypothetical protein